MKKRKLIKIFIMKSFLIINTYVFIMISLNLNAQITFEKSIGNSEFQGGWSVQQTNDGGYIIGGNTYIGSKSKIYAVKTDEYGDTIWTKSYGNDQWDDLKYEVYQTFDGGYIVGSTYCSNSCDTLDFYLVKTDQYGNILWEKKYDNNGNEDVGSSLIPTNDGGYVITGHTMDTLTEISKLYTIKTDQSGIIQWDKIINEPYTIGMSVRELNSGGYIIGGMSDMNFYLVKLDLNGDTVWTKTYNKGPSFDSPILTIEQCTDGGFVFFSSTTVNSNIYSYLFKVNANGDSLWAKNNYQNASFTYGVQTSDGGLVMTGIEDIYNNASFLIVKTDDNGITLWERTYVGKGGYSYGTSIKQTNDYGYIVTGITTDSLQNNDDVYLIKTDENGYVNINIENKNNDFAIIYPNPCNQYLNINSSENINCIKIYNPNDILLDLYNFYYQNNNISIEMKDYANGLYFIELISDKHKIIKKIIKE